MINCTAAVQIAVSFLWAINTAAIAPSTVRRANSQMNIRCTAAVHIAFALPYTHPRWRLFWVMLLFFDTVTTGAIFRRQGPPFQLASTTGFIELHLRRPNR